MCVCVCVCISDYQDKIYEKMYIITVSVPFFLKPSASIFFFFGLFWEIKIKI